MAYEYCSVNEVRAYINKTVNDAASVADFDTNKIIEAIIQSVCKMIDLFCNRPDGFRANGQPATRIFSGSGLPYMMIDECAAITSVAVKDSVTDTTYTAWASTDWIPASGDPRFPDYNRTPYNLLLANPNGDYSVFTDGRMRTTIQGFRPTTEAQRGLPTVQVRANWGYALDTPPSVKQAAITETARIYKRGMSAYADGIANAELGQMVYAQELDPITKNMLINARLVRPTIGGRF